MRHLSHHRVCIKHRLAFEHPGIAALVDDDLLTERVQIHGGKLRHQHPVADLVGGPQQVAQPFVLGLQCSKLLQFGLEFEVFLLRRRLDCCRSSRVCRVSVTHLPMLLGASARNCMG